MKVGAKVYLFNARMVARRKELGLSQFDLAALSDVSYTDIQRMERLERLPGAGKDAVKARSVNDKLQRIANALELPFDELFPGDYLQKLQEGLFPRRREPYIWIRETALDALPPNAAVLALPGPEDLLDRAERAQLKSLVEGVLAELHPIDQDLIRLRFGIEPEDDAERTFEEVALTLSKRHHYLVTRTRIAQREQQILRWLRHPKRSRQLRDFWP